MNAISPALRAAHDANRAAIGNAETPDQIVARLRAQCRTEMNIRGRAVGAAVSDAGGSLGEEIIAVTKEMERIRTEYGAMIARHRPKLSDRPGTAPYDPVFDNTAASHSYFGRL